MSEELDQARDELNRALQDLQDLTGDGPGTDLVRTRSSDPAVAKDQMVEQRAAMLRTQEIARKASEKLERVMKAEMAKVARALQPLEDAVEQLTEGLFSINLYLGRDEEILLLRDGASAPAEQPVTLRQMVLYMDEEMAAGADGLDGGIDPKETDRFDEWLLSDPAHLDQVLPETKGIVALRPRRRAPRRDGWRNDGDAAANRRTYWLIRNGERVYRTVTLLQLQDRVLPYADEMTRLFMRSTGDGDLVALKPGSYEWEQAQETAEDREALYMRVGLVLEGLLHRTPVFHPLPEYDISFLDPRCVRDGKVRYITDAEAALGTGMESFADWRARLASELRVGMRIILGPGLRDYNHDRRPGNERIHPTHAELPETGRIYTIEERKGNQLTFRYHEGARYVSDGGYGRYTIPKRRASCRVFAHDEFLLPLDLAEVADMRRFITARTDREHYETMMPILKTAIAAKQHEAEVEQPFCDMLAGVLARDNGVSVQQAQEAVPDLVDWWKFKNKFHRPLLLEAHRPADDAEYEKLLSETQNMRRSQAAEARAILQARAERQAAEDAEQVTRSQAAVSQIVAEHARRLADDARPVDAKVLAKLHAAHPYRLLVARPRGRGYVVLVAARPDEDVFAHLYEYSARGELKDTQQWLLPRRGIDRQWKVLESCERWSGWKHEADLNRVLRGPEADDLLDQTRALFDAAERPLVLARDLDGNLSFWTYTSGPSYDEQHLLSEDSEPPAVTHTQTSWRRTANGVKLTAGVRRGWSSDVDRLHRRSDTLPWDTREWRSHFDDHDKPQRRQYEILDSDAAQLRTLDADRDRYAKVADRRDTLRERARTLTWSVKEAWLRDRWAAERVRFDEDFGDAALWPAHRTSVERTITFPGSYRLQDDSRHLVLFDAVARLVEIGEDPEGRTAGDVVDEVTRRFGEQEAAKDDWHRVDTAGPVKTFELHADLRDIVLTDYTFEHTPDPEPDTGDGDDADLDFDVLAGVRDALQGDRGPDFDADADFEEDGLDEDIPDADEVP